MKCIEWNDELNFLFCFCAAEKKTAVIRLLFVTISISLICMHIEIGPILCIQLHLTKFKNTNTQIKPQNTYTEIEIRLADKCSLAYNRLLRASWLSQVLSFFFFHFKYNAVYGAAMAKLCVCTEKLLTRISFVISTLVWAFERLTHKHE